MLNKINSSIKNIHAKTIGMTLALSLATSALVHDVLDTNIDTQVMDLQPASNSYLNKKFNNLRNELRELQKDGLSSQEEVTLEGKITEYTNLEDKIELLNDSINFDILYDSEEEDEFSELLMHKIIDNFDVNNTEDNINTVMKNFILLLNEVSHGKHDQSRSPINQGDIENTQNFIYQQNGEIKIDGIDIAFNIDNDKKTIKFMIELYNFEKEYSFDKTTKYNNVSFDTIDIQDNISDIKDNPSNKSEQLSGNSFFDSLKNGEYIPEQTFENNSSEISYSAIKGHKIKHDNGADFIEIKAGDSLSKIKSLLSNSSEYSYLKDSKYSNSEIKGFNIDKEATLQIDMWVPIPLERDQKILSEKDFLHYGFQAIEEMKEDKVYGMKFAELLDVMTEQELLSLALGVAKQESNLGNIALHRYEQVYRVFSYGYYHILGVDLCEEIIDKLGISTGELMNPKQGTKAFIAFMLEKNKDIGNAFPLDNAEKLNTFAKKYNGARWLRDNPDYLENVVKYTNEGNKILGGSDDIEYTKISHKYIVNKKSRKSEIKDFQKNLQKSGFMSLTISANGNYGPNTIEATKKLQKALGVEQTGYYDYLTVVAVADLQKKNFPIDIAYHGMIGQKTIKLLKSMS